MTIFLSILLAIYAPMALYAIVFTLKKFNIDGDNAIPIAVFYCVFCLISLLALIKILILSL
jgi:hypothetical protein